MKVLIAGDYCPRDRVARNIQNGTWQDVLSEVKPFVQSADLAIVNFECPIVEGKDTPIFKNGPLLKCAPQSVEMIKDAGFRLVTLANNHFRDQGDNGVKTTISTLKNYGIDYVGGGIDIKEASQTYYYEYNGKKNSSYQLL